ncbi:MAG: Lrp/AsnC family transcriptional regulator [Deltaproteobacteria bacterium]|nr:Lrp/AsnC family transcriptional regulator [Deltaproteobacteria bacterium]MBW2417901.1 Lrp/AsnC family transcriptional regulator [Deltaproteobacteria bacterium]
MRQYLPQNIDKIDRAILEALQRDASVSTTELAKRVGLSISPCWRRIRRLESLGVIRERVAILDRDRLGFEVTVFASLKLSSHGRQSLVECEQAIASFPEVMESYAMTGDVDYLLKVVTRDIRAYERFLRERLLQLPFVREVHSQIALSQLKYTTRLPLESLASDAD